MFYFQKVLNLSYNVLIQIIKALKDAEGQKGINKWKLFLGVTNHLAFHHFRMWAFCWKRPCFEQWQCRRPVEETGFQLGFNYYSTHRKLSIMVYINKMIRVKNISSSKLDVLVRLHHLSPATQLHLFHTLFECKWNWYFTIKVKLLDILVNAFSGLKT